VSAWYFSPLLALTLLLGVDTVRLSPKRPVTLHPADRTVSAAVPFDPGGEVMPIPQSFDRFDFSTSDRWLQLALFDPCDDEPEPLRVFGLYPDTQESRDYLADVLHAYRQHSLRRPEIYHCLGVFPAKVSA
jgi:hypothetical protein